MSCENKIQTLIRLSPGDEETLAKLAELEGRTRSDVVARLLFREALTRELAPVPVAK